jgi:Fe2+ or Zn2+ uptake regulation protein
MSMTINSNIHQEVALRLASQEQRYTRLRKALIETMADAGRPVTIVEILYQNPGLSQSSAYRNVSVLIDAGAARRVAGTDDHGRFELAEDLSGHHHHLVCSTCGKVADVLPSARLERAFAEAARTAAGREDFAVTDHRFDLVGLCADCQ